MCIFDLDKRVHRNGGDHSGNTLTESCDDQLWYPAEEHQFPSFLENTSARVGKTAFLSIKPNGSQVTVL